MRFGAWFTAGLSLSVALERYSFLQKSSANRLEQGVFKVLLWTPRALLFKMLPSRPPILRPRRNARRLLARPGSIVFPTWMWELTTWMLRPRASSTIASPGLFSRSAVALESILG